MMSHPGYADNNECPYLTVNDINNLKVDNSNTLSFLHINIASLKLHQDELNLLIETCDIKFKFVGISETGFNKHSLTNIPIEGFTSLDCFTESSKGGTRLYVSNDTNIIPRPDLEIYKRCELESTIVEVINENNQNYFV